MKQQGDAGVAAFSLLEVMVAFIILALAMGMVLQTINLGARSTAAADEKRQVMALVDELRAEKLVGAASDIEAMESGRKDGFRWELRPIIAPSGPQEFEPTSTGLILLKIFPTSDSSRYYDFLLPSGSTRP